jgi:hypothetical protein
VPWLDSLTALAAVVACSGDARLFTTVANPVVRGPVALAKVLGGLDIISGGRVVAALGPGSSDREHASVGVPFDERWKRFDEAVSAVRALLLGGSFRGSFYGVDGPLGPRSPQPDGPPLWVVAGGPPRAFVGQRGSAMGGWHRRTTSPRTSSASAGPGSRRCWSRPVAFGSSQAVLDKIGSFRDAGVQHMFVWPVVDDLEQLHRFGTAVMAPLRA